VVVVGDVDPDQVHALAKQYFGPLKPSEIEPAKPRREVLQRGGKRIEGKAPAELPYLIMGYKVPVVLTAAPDALWEPYALDVLAGVLDGGTGARLASELVRGQAVAASAGAAYDGYDRQQSLFLLSGTPANGNTTEQLEHALRAQIKRLHEERVGSDELERVKAQIRASKVYEQDSIFYQAMQIGMLETVGLDWSEMERYHERINAVTPEQVQAVARKYFDEDSLTVVTLLPQPLDQARARPAAGLRH
jgi:zinc protease